MVKKALSAALSVIMCLQCQMPVMAAETDVETAGQEISVQITEALTEETAKGEDKDAAEKENTEAEEIAEKETAEVEE